MSYELNTTICAIATAPGGALGIIRISGAEAILYTNRIFSKDITYAKGYTIHYGVIIDSKKSNQSTDFSTQEILSTPLDEVIISVCRAPHSYTGEDTVEISCHGSSYIQQRIIQLLVENGCKLAKPGEYTQRAFLNGKLDLSQAEAVADLIASQNMAQHRVAMSQMRGGISRRLSELRNQLLQMTSLLELELDFSEEDVEFASREKLHILALEIEKEIVHLDNSFSTGNAIKNGIPVAIIGAPNVGKSTLLNQLLQDDKAIVSDIAGTTRDTIEDTITIDGTLFRFIDTAGLRHTDDKIENLGIERSLKAVKQAQIILMLTEPGVPYPTIETNDTQLVIRILNKSDNFQAINGKGIDQLLEQLRQFVKKLTLTSDDILITNLRHKEALDLALLDIRRAITALQVNLSGDLIAEELRQCLTHLSDILGTSITSDEVLGNIFSHFCIGK